MRSASSLAIVLVLSGATLGCGASAPAPGAASTTPVGAQAAAEEREREAALAALKARENEIRELKGQLALAKAEAHELRETQVHRSEFQRETVRIGSGRREADVWEESGAIDDSGPRPVLRLYGDAPSAGTGGGLSRWESGPAPRSEVPPLVIPEAPPGVETRLPVAPLPGGPAFTAQARPALELGAAPQSQDEAVVLYQAALKAVSERKLGSALRALHGFLVKFPAHPYAHNALYWKGEVLYAERQYAQAVQAYEEVVRKQPRGSKSADALFKLGMSLRRMGNVQAAKQRFQQVQAQYPGSVAARLAAEEIGR